MKKIELSELSFDALTKTGRDLAVLAAGVPEDFNMMTIGWATYGTLWREPVATVYVRHSRYTLEFTEKNDCFSITFLKPGHEKILGTTLGSKSGRDIDKMHESGLTPVFVDGVPCFEEAALTLICQKVYRGEITEDQFLDRKPFEQFYADGDMHTFYVGRVLAAYVAD
ncbi:MAG: flavin reductase [Butyricicoccus sp.]|nr:flavin reductase [Butyricicoccus sp.]